MQEGLEREVEIASREKTEALVCMQVVQHSAIFRPRDFCEASARGDQVLGELHPHRHCHCLSEAAKTEADKKVSLR